MFVMSYRSTPPDFCHVQQHIAQKTTCFHCGDACKEDHLRFDEKDFCCQGCKAVYGLLQESGLCDYYALTEQPGVKEERDTTELRPELFDLAEVRDKLVEYSEDGITRVTLNIPQMHCSSCIWLLENLQRVESAIIRSRVPILREGAQHHLPRITAEPTRPGRTVASHRLRTSNGPCR
jgi:Cu+-exporting ATPase